MIQLYTHRCTFFLKSLPSRRLEWWAGPPGPAGRGPLSSIWGRHCSAYHSKLGSTPPFPSPRNHWFLLQVCDSIAGL